MGFVMAGLDSEPYDRQYSDRELIRRIVQYFAQRKRSMLIATGAIFAGSLFSAGVPILVSQSVDMLAVESDVRRFILLAAGAATLQSLAWVLNWLRQRHSSRAIGDVVLELRSDVFRAVVSHDLSFYDEQPTGKIVSRVTSDTQDFAATVDLTMNLASQLLTVILVLIITLTISVPLSLVMVMVTPFFFGLALSYRKIARKATRNARRVLAKVNANIQESVSGIAVAKSFRREHAMYQDFTVLNKQAFRVNLIRGVIMQTIFPTVGGASGITAAIMLYLGGRSALASVNPAFNAGILGSITIGQWFLFMQGIMYFLWPMISIASFWSQFQDGLSSAERVFSLIDAEPRVVQTGSQRVPEIEGHVQFDRVHLSYTGDQVVLPELTLEIRAGESVALVGHTGAGKTSIARLLGRYYEFQGGKILIDGMDIRSFDLSDYRRHIGFVPQTPFLFSGTVLENIAYGQPEATREDVEAAAGQISAGDWLHDLQSGLDTDVGERGARLSMGQRQLVALARVLIQNPAILVLDEATASVDPFTEAQIQEGLEIVMQNRTSLVIAHRLSTVRHADRIIVLADGRIIEEGDHESLIAQGGHYSELYNTYFRHQSWEYIESARSLAEGA